MSQESMEREINDNLVRTVFGNNRNEQGTMFDAMTKMSDYLHYYHLSRKTKLKLRIRYRGRSRIPSDVIEKEYEKEHPPSPEPVPIYME